MSDPPVAAVVVAYNSAGVLPACLAALAAQGVPAIVVDNASSDDSAAIAQKHGARVLVSAKNCGFGRGCNFGAVATGAPFILFVNPDCVLEKGAVAELLAAAARYPGAALFAPRVRGTDGTVAFGLGTTLAPYLAKGGGTLPDGDCCVPGASGAAFMVRAEAFAEIDGFDPNIFLYYEDDDLTRRLIDAGHSVVHVDAANATHLHGRSTASRRGVEFLKRWHLAWSRCYVMAKYGRKPPVWRLIRRHGRHWLVAAATLRWSALGANAGMVAGAWAWRKGRGAMERQGLPDAATAARPTADRAK